MTKQQWDRDGIRDQVMALMEANGWSYERTGKVLDVSKDTISRLVRNTDRWHDLSNATTKRIADGLAKLASGGDDPVTVEPDVFDDEPVLPVARSSNMLTARSVNGQEVFTYRDIATGFQVDEVTVRQAYNNNKNKWGAGETFLSNISIGGLSREMRLFTAAGTLRFCRHIFSGRSDEMFQHIRDYWLAGHQQQQQGAAVDAVMAQVMAAFAGQMGAQFNAVQQELTQVKAMAEQTRQAVNSVPVAAEQATQAYWQRLKKGLDGLAAGVEKLVSLLIRQGHFANTKKGRAAAYSTVNGSVNDRFSVQNRQGLTADQAEDAVAFIKSEYHKALNINGQRVIDFPGA